MQEYTLETLRLADPRVAAAYDALLQQNGLVRDAQLQYAVGIYDGQRLAAAGGCFANTLRCLAVDDADRGEGLLNRVVTHLAEWQYAQGNSHQFLYTKCGTAHFFADLGFYEIARVQDRLVFMENRRDGFARYLQSLTPADGTSAGIVMNANPFTLGHLHLVRKAAAENDRVHLFVVSEDRSHFTAAERFELVRQGVAALPNVVLHPTESYLISSAVFPAYFLKSEQEAILAQAALDAALFVRIAARLGLRRRYVGEEPASMVTALYNEVLGAALPAAGVDCVVVPRLQTAAGEVISASAVRRCIAAGNAAALQSLLPPTTLAFLQSPQGAKVQKRLAAAAELTHY